MKWTLEQSKAIKERNKNILVSAAAGSGKTAVLVERILGLILGDEAVGEAPVPVESILIVTFTKAAAAEMRQKIIAALGAKLEDDDSPYLRKQLRKAYVANISTLNAFALSIVKRYYYVIGKDPSLSVGDTYRLEFLSEEALDILLAECFEDSEKSAEFVDFMNRYAGNRNENAVREMIRDCYTFVRTMPNPWEWLDEKCEELLLDWDEYEKSEAFLIFAAALRSEITAIAEGFSEVASILDRIGADGLAAKALIDSEVVAEAAVLIEQGQYEAARELLLGFKAQTFRAKKEEQEVYDEYKVVITSKRDALKKRLKEGIIAKFFVRPFAEQVKDVKDTYSSAKLLGELILRYHEIYSDLKEKDGIIDFADTEHMALEILDEPAVCEEYREKFKYIFIDEYQDNNYVQEALISRIKREDNLFMVGDIKQSIYKFRLAEPKIFIDKYNNEFTDDGSEGNIRIDLNQNFRSKRLLIDSINSLFRPMMHEDVSGIEYDDKAALHSGLDYDEMAYDGKADRFAELCLVDMTETDIDDESDEEADISIKDISVAEVEATLAASKIKAALGETFLDIKAEPVPELRKFRYRDIVILLREAKSSAQVWQRVLQEHGIPAYVSTGDGYFDAVEVAVLINLLKTIDNLRQDVPLVSVMYSSIFGFTTEELIEIRLARPDGAYYFAVLECAGSVDVSLRPQSRNPVLAEKCQALLNRISKWRDKEKFMALPEFIWYLLEDSGFYDYAGALPGGSKRRANLRSLVDRAQLYQSDKIRGLFSFLNFLDRVKINKLAIAEAKTVSEGEDIVRIMTIHNSKGLEFPMTILGQLAKTFPNSSNHNRYDTHHELGLALQWEDYEHHVYRKTLLQQMISFVKKREDRAETLRVLYVAMTRAMDRLVIIGAGNKLKEKLELSGNASEVDARDVMAASSYLDLLLPLPKASGMEVEFLNYSDVVSVASQPDNSRKVSMEAILEELNNAEPSENYEEIDRRFSFVYDTGSPDIKAKYSVTEIARLMKLDENQKDEISGQARNGNSRHCGPGTAIQPFDVSYFIEDSEHAISEDEGMLSESVRGRELGGLNAAERGTALHTVFEHLNYSEINVSEVGDKYLDGLERDGFITAAERAVVDAEILQRYVSTEIFARAKTADEDGALRRETPFTLRHTLKSKITGREEEVIVQGIIDLWFTEGDDIILVDYKSGYRTLGSGLGEAKIKEKYFTQISLYKEALTKITGKKVKETYLYMTDTGITIPV